MGKVIIILLYYGLFIISVGGGQINSDPAPGRSPGPPGINTINDDHGIISDSPTFLVTQDDNFSNINNDEYIDSNDNDMLSAVKNDSEKQQEIDSIKNISNNNLIINNTNTNITIDINEKYNLNNTTVDEIKANSDKIDKNQLNNLIKKSSSILYDESYDITQDTLCKNRLNDYLHRDEKIVTVESYNNNNISNNDDISLNQKKNPDKQHVEHEDHQEHQEHLKHDIKLDVIHDMFDIHHNGITCGLMYKIRISTQFPSIIEDFYVETLTDNKSRGSFVGHVLSNKLPISWFKIPFIKGKNSDKTNGNYIKKSPSSWDVDHIEDENENILKPVDRWIEQEDNESSLDEDKNSNKDDANCNENTWSENLNGKNEIFAFWMINEFCDRNDKIEFRVFFRPSTNISRNDSELFNLVVRKSFTFNIIKGCQLKLKETSGTLDYSSLPLYNIDCIVYFPSDRNISSTSQLDQQQQQQQQQSGLLMNLIRLNIPCNSGGFIKFSNNLQLCGKLEELTDNQRTYHFNINNNISILIHKNPMFNLNYKLVDYCYNMSLNDRNGSFYIKPIRTTLECYFQIHLPYGNKIDLKLITNNNSLLYKSDNNKLKNEATFENFDNFDNINNKPITTHINISLSNNNINSDNISLVNDYRENLVCNGLLIRIYDTKMYKWSYCIKELSDMKIFSLLSHTNILIIHVIKNSMKKLQFQMNSDDRLEQQPEQQYDLDLNKSITTSTLYFSYSFKPIPEIVSDCTFGWVAVQQFCVRIVDTLMSWYQGEQHCVNFGGHLASIRSENEQKAIDEFLLNSPGYQDHQAFWVGASDKNFEGDFRWTDGLPFSYANWFPGWSQHGHYNKQPNDDGLSGQDCIELRRYFRIPPSVQQSKTPLSNTYMWNDRDCNAKNYVICERPIADEPIVKNWVNDCNKTISLSKEHPRASVWSPSFPRQYPDNANCYTTVTAPSSYRIVLEFEELVIENEPGCSYDYLEITEPTVTHSNLKNIDSNFQRTSRHGGLKRNPFRKRNSYDSLSLSNNNFEMNQMNYQNLLGVFNNLYKPRSNFLIQTPDYPRGNPLYHTNKLRNSLPRRMCGDWSSKLKLLRYVSNGSYLGLHFISDYSHHYGGFKAKVFMENRGHWVRAASECSDERLKAYNGSCYLMVSYPEVDWWTAQSICRGMGSQLTSVSTPDEHRFITTAIRNQPDYSPQVIYWLGGELVNSQQFEWTDGAKMTFQGWLPGQGQFDKLPIESVCLGLQWKMSPTPMLPSGLYWDAQKCRRMGGYVCKKRKQEFDPYEVRNETVNGIEGRLISPGYPNPYPLSIDYWVRIVAPERSRIIVQFQKIDLESQDECLYDYVSVQNYETVSEISLEPGTNLIPMAMLKSDKFYDIPYGNERIDYIRRYRNADNYITKSAKNLTPLNLKSTKIKMKLKRSLVEIPKSQINNYYQENKLLRNSFNEILQLNRKHRRKKRDFSELLNTPLVNDKINTKTKHNSFEYLIKENVDNAQTFLPYVRWCGSHEANMSKFDFISSSNEVMLNFHSDYSMAGGGFAAIWKVVDISGCPLQTLTAREGIITSPNYPHFLINNLDCTFIIQAPIGRKVWLEFIDYRIDDGATIDIDIGYGNFQAYNKKDHLNEGIFISIHEQIKIQIRTASKPRGRGFQATYKTVGPPIMERVIHLSNSSKGFLYHLNYPQMIPENIEFTQHLLAPLGAVILLEFNGVEFSQNGCADQNVLEIYDNYGDNGTKWQLCKYENHSFTTTDRNNINLPDSDTTLSMGRLRLGRSDAQQAPIFITSYLNTIHIRQRTSILTESKIILNATVHVQQDINYKLKLASGDDYVESCQPNPCQFDGKCITGDSGNRCQCQGHYTGRFCGLTMCELEPCVFGKCELTLTNFKCHCQKGYIGTTCEEKQKPCAENPCEGRGDCFEKNGRFFCRCHAWWEGQRCERKMLHIPYKPLSERMLQEPFWLGLITVFVVLGVIGLVWCAKRHFPEKIEKLLAEENDRNRPPGSVHGHHHTSLREQLQFTTSIPQTASTTSTMPGFNPPRSIFNRLGIRKPSILSLSSPNPPGGATARTFSLDDLLRPPPRRSPSPRKKRNNSTPTKKNAAEKKQILQQLISPAPTQVRPKISLGELIQMSENRMKSNCIDSESDLKETTFSENSGSASTLTARPLLNDPKLEKKVTFARLLSKVSAEMSSGSEMDGNGTRNSSALSLPTEIQYRPNSLPQSPCTNDIRSPHSTSSNQGSDSLSSSELALTDIGLRNLAQNISNNINNNNRRIRPKVSSADSILAMFRNFASTSSSGTNVQASSSVFVSPSTTPTACSPQDDAPGDDESSTSSMHTPVSFSSGAPDSPVFYRQTTIEVPVLDALSAHKVVPNTNLLHPPTILLEIPNNGINKCLSPIRELPTPMPSPALTPIMPRPRRSNSPIIQNDNDTASCSEDDEDNSRSEQTSAQYMSELQKEMCRIDSEIDTTPTDTATTSFAMMNRAPLLKSKSISPIANITIDIEPPTPEEKTPRPTELIIPTLIVQQPSPTKDRFPMIIFPGSPPPQRASIGETSFMFPNKQQQKRLLKQFEKPTSLDLPFAPPTITVTSNMSELESDIEPMSPAPNKIGGTTTLVVPGGNAVGMCYLSPFAMCTRADRTISESNLSSSGYSSMASPGTSRCGSSNPLCPNEMDESGSGPSGTNLSLHANLLSRRQSTLLASCKENITNGKSSNESGNHDRLRGRSDSETLSDDPLLESNDEGIGTDHLDEKLEDGEMKTIKELEIFIEQDLVETGKNILNSEESLPMSQLQLPSIVIQSDGNDRGLSPVSSRSESPLSERASMGRFSPHFYGRKDQQLPFTDSDGLYDFPSSDGKGTLVTHQRRSSKKRERKSSKTGLTQSPTRNQNLDLPTKEANISSSHNCSKHFHHLHHSHHGATITTRKSPKRRPIQRHPVESSSSSTESLTSARELTFRAAKGGSPSRERFVRDCGEGSGDDTGEDVSSQILPNAHSDDIVRPRKISRLKAIGNQIRFLRRLEQSIKQRDRLRSPSDSCPEDDLDSPRITSPLLKNVSTKSRISLCRQKRLPTNLYSTTTLLNSSEHNNWRTREKNIIHGDINSD